MFFILNLFTGTKEERIALLNAVRGSSRAKRFFAYPDAKNEDVEFDLMELERVPIGQSFNVTITIKVIFKKIIKIKSKFKNLTLIKF